MRISDWSSDVCSSDLARIGCLSCFRRSASGSSAPDQSRAARCCCSDRPTACADRSGRDTDQCHAEGDCRERGRRDRMRKTTVLDHRSEEHTSELQSLMRISYAVFGLKKKTTKQRLNNNNIHIITSNNHII